MLTVELKQYGERKQDVQVSTLREASQKVRAFIDERSIGSSMWEGGLVRVDGKRKFLVSYNGRVWHYSPEGWTPETPEVLGDDLDARH